MRPTTYWWYLRAIELGLALLFLAVCVVLAWSLDNLIQFCMAVS